MLLFLHQSCAFRLPPFAQSVIARRRSTHALGDQFREHGRGLASILHVSDFIEAVRLKLLQG